MDFEKLQEYVNNIMNSVIYDYKGDVDFNRTNDICVLIIYIEFKNKLILLKHTEDKQGTFDVLNGLCEQTIPIQKMIFEQIEDELEVIKEDVLDVKIGDILKNYDSQDSITYHEIPFLIKLSAESVITPFEEMEIKYVDIDKMYNMNLKKGLIKKYIELKR